MRAGVLVITTIAGLLLYPLATHFLILINAEHFALIGLMGLSALAVTWRWWKQKSIALGGVELYLIVLIVGTINLFTLSAQALSVPFVVVNFMLAIFVLRSLEPARVPVFERIVRLAHGENLPARVCRLARLFTRIWGWYFMLVAAVSLTLALVAPLAWWSWFSNIGYFVVTPLVVGVMHVYQVTVFRRHGVAMTWRELLRVAKTPVSDPRHPLSGFRRG
ncbi:MAG: hypothetical protein OEZ10_05180 [Gammaproteobacteria bacterium]|nr:hypothetical protein [Gammaproteobacteria bacterium]